MLAKQLFVGWNAYGDSYYNDHSWISFISSTYGVKNDYAHKDQGGMLINVSSDNKYDYCYIPTKDLSRMLILDGVSGSYLYEKILYVYHVKPSDFNGDTATINMNSYGNIVSAMLCHWNESQKGQIMYYPTIRWENGTLYLYSTANSEKKYFILWIIIEKKNYLPE